MDLLLLIKEAQKGDKEAFIEAVNEYMPQMYRIARAKLEIEDDIGDAIQETILSAFKNLKGLRNPCYFKTWITRILINECNDILKKSSKVVLADNYFENSSNEVEYVDEKKSTDNLELKDALMSLNSNYRIVLVLYYINGFNSKEISKILNEKEGTVRSRLSRAREQLKVYYSNKLEVKCYE